MARPFDLLGVCEKKGTLTERGGAASRCGQYYGQLPERRRMGKKMDNRINRGWMLYGVGRVSQARPGKQK